MSLDLSNTALQIDHMARELKARSSDRRARLSKAMEAITAFDAQAHARKHGLSRATLAWPAAEVRGDPRAHYPPPPLPQDFCVVGVDGSHIDVDRHIPARCFLINIGVVVLRYGSQPDARLSSQPKLYAQDEELVMRDRVEPYREQAIEGAVLGARRTVEEARALAQAVADLPPDMPTLALMDGSLLLMGIVGHGYHDFVQRQLIQEGFVAALEDLRRLAASRPLAVASYISLPRSSEVTNALRLEVCPFEVARCDALCGKQEVSQRPCEQALGGLLDRQVFWELLEPGERSCLFASTSPVVQNYYQGQDIHFFYLHAGQEIGRVEVPLWVAEDEALLGLAHALVIDQCRRGPGYPVALMEAHEQAVVTGADRRAFLELVEGALEGQRLPMYYSEKSRSKRLRWV